MLTQELNIYSHIKYYYMKTNATLQKINRSLLIYLVIALLTLGISEQSLLLGQNCSTEQISLTHLDQSALENCSLKIIL